MPRRQAGPADAPAVEQRDDTMAEALELYADAANARAKEAKELYAPLAAWLDKFMRAEAYKALPQHQRSACKAFCDDLALVARRHFDAYTRGIPRPPAPYTATAYNPPTPPPEAETNQALLSSAQQPMTYAQAAQTSQSPQTAPANNTQRLQRAATNPTNSPRAMPKTPSLDNRLFVRLEQTSPIRQLPGYTVLAQLRAQHNTIGRLIAEIQPTKTGFALKPTQDATTSLETHIPELQAFFKGAPVEKSVSYNSYRLSLVPRRIILLDETNTPTQVDVTADMVGQAIFEATNTLPALASQTKGSLESEHEHITSWIIRIPSELPTLPRGFNIFGVRVSAKVLPQRVTIAQCSKCLQWHNSRACNRQNRCVLCGSTEHTHDNHPQHLVPRCIHCHGPHAADFAECLLRPKANTKLSKAQKAEIRRASAATRAQIIAGKAQKQGQSQEQVDPMDTTPIPQPNESTPFRTPPLRPQPDESALNNLRTHSVRTILHSIHNPSSQMDPPSPTPAR